MRYFAFFPTEAQNLMQFSDEALFAALENFSRDTIVTRCFARRKEVQGFAELSSCWFSIEFLNKSRVF